MQKLFSNFNGVTTEEWKNKILAELKGKDFSEVISKSDDEIEIPPFYQARDTENVKDCDVFCNPKKNIYGEKNIYQVINKRTAPHLSNLSNQGAKSWEIVCENFLGNGGLTVDQNLFNMYKNIPIAENTFYLRGGLQSIAVWDLFQKFCQEHEIDPKGAIDNDPIIELMLRSELPDKNDFLRMKEIVEQTSSHFAAITLQGQNFQNLGSSLVQELAFTFTTAIEYCDQLSNLGLSYDQIISRMQFSFAVSNNYFLEIAKLRAAKLIWANIASQFDLSCSFPIRIHAETSLWNKSSSDAHTNIIRTTIESMAALLSGCNSLTIHPFDMTCETTNLGLRVAQNMYNILQEEAFLDKCLNPCSGSFFIESMTNNIVQKTWSLIQEIEQQGGFLSALKKNYISQEIEKKKTEKEKDILDQSQILIGINKYQLDTPCFPLSEANLPQSDYKQQINSRDKLSQAICDVGYREVISSFHKKRTSQIQPMKHYHPETSWHTANKNSQGNQ